MGCRGCTIGAAISYENADHRTTAPQPQRALLEPARRRLGGVWHYAVLRRALPAVRASSSPMRASSRYPRSRGSCCRCPCATSTSAWGGAAATRTIIMGVLATCVVTAAALRFVINLSYKQLIEPRPAGADPVASSSAASCRRPTCSWCWERVVLRHQVLQS